MTNDKIQFNGKCDADGTTYLFFDAPKEMLKALSAKEYSEAVSMTICIHFPTNSVLPKEKVAAVRISPRNAEGEDYDYWTDSTLGYEDISELIQLAGQQLTNPTGEILNIVEDTVLQLEENSFQCLNKNDIPHSEMYSHMAEGARCVKQNLEHHFSQKADEEMDKKTDNIQAKEIEALKAERDRFLTIAYNAICLGQLDEQYSESTLRHELGCSKEEYKKIMES